MNQTAEQWEKDQAQKLLAELSAATASKTPTPLELQDWNIRAQTLLTFAACRLAVSQKFGLPENLQDCDIADGNRPLLKLVTAKQETTKAAKDTKSEPPAAGPF